MRNFRPNGLKSSMVIQRLTSAGSLTRRSERLEFRQSRRCHRRGTKQPVKAPSSVSVASLGELTTFR